MRRALLLAALAAPVLAAAQQTAGDGNILFSQGNDDTDYIRGEWISEAECDDAAATVKLSWDTALVAGFPANGTYQAYAADKVVPADRTTCFENDETNIPGVGSVIAGPVGIPIGAEREVMNFQVYEVADFKAALDITACPTTNKEIFVCMQLKDGSGNVAGLARGKLTIDVNPPGPPTGVNAVAADDDALEITWDSPTGSPTAYDFRITVVSADPRDTTLHEAREVFGERFVMTGLVDQVTYTINVFAVSRAGNESAASANATGTPTAVYDLWEIYGRKGGVDAGGCASGGAAPLALLGIAALLAKLRRRA